MLDMIDIPKEPIPKLAKCGCGGEAQFIIAHPNENDHILFPHFGVSCKKCRVMIGTTVHGLTDFFDTPHEAAEAWNRLRGEN